MAAASMPEDDVLGVNDARDVPEQGQHNVLPEVALEADLQANADRWPAPGFAYTPRG